MLIIKKGAYCSFFYNGWLMGFEPTTLGTTNRCSNQLSYSHHDLDGASRAEKRDGSVPSTSFGVKHKHAVRKSALA